MAVGKRFMVWLGPLVLMLTLLLSLAGVASASDDEGKGNALAAYFCPQGPSYAARVGYSYGGTVARFVDRGECVSFFAKHPELREQLSRDQRPYIMIVPIWFPESAS